MWWELTKNAKFEFLAQRAWSPGERGRFADFGTRINPRLLKAFPLYRRQLCSELHPRTRIHTACVHTQPASTYTRTHSWFEVLARPTHLCVVTLHASFMQFQQTFMHFQKPSMQFQQTFMQFQKTFMHFIESAHYIYYCDWLTQFAFPTVWWRHTLARSCARMWWLVQTGSVLSWLLPI